jgi:lysophospholipase L1-like esterase
MKRIERNHTKLIIKYVAIFGVGLVLFWVFRLLILYRNIAGFNTYWKQRSSVQGEITYVALGDSAAQGLGANKPQNGYVGLIANEIAQKSGKSVRVVNVSKTGAKIQDVLDSQLDAIKEIKADIITIEIGANDIKNFDEAMFRARFDELASRLPKGTYVSNMPYWGSRPKSRPDAFRASEIVKQVVDKYPGLNFVDLQTITQSRNTVRGYAADYFHPNDHSYKNWSEVFWGEIRKHKI